MSLVPLRRESSGSVFLQMQYRSGIRISNIVDSYNVNDTKEYARKLAEEVQPGTVICLDGDLGAGKTVFAKGFAEGLGIQRNITSPTFTLLNIYEEGRLPLYHYDVYRVNDIDEDEYFYGDGVCLIEWADNIRELIPTDAIHIEIKRNPDKGEEYREIIRR